MVDQEDVSTGELYRLCLRIEAAVNKTNGRVSDLEKDAIRIKAFWTAGTVGLAIFGDWLKHKVGL